MFITVEGFNRTGIPSTLWNATKSHAEINHTSGVAVLALVILVLSNIASNVPTGKLLLVFNAQLCMQLHKSYWGNYCDKIFETVFPPIPSSSAYVFEYFHGKP